MPTSKDAVERYDDVLESMLTTPAGQKELLQAYHRDLIDPRSRTDEHRGLRRLVASITFIEGGRIVSSNPERTLDGLRKRTVSALASGHVGAGSHVRASIESAARRERAGSGQIRSTTPSAPDGGDDRGRIEGRADVRARRRQRP